MSDVYLRKWKLVIGFNGEVNSEVVVASPKEYPERRKEDGGLILYKERYKTKGPTTNLVTTPPVTIEISSPLQLSAEIEDNKATEKTTTAANRAKIRVYNLSEDVSNRIKVGWSVFLYAGYEQDLDLPLVFVGQATVVRVTKEGADIITIIEADAADLVRNGAKISKSYPPDSELRHIIEDLAANVAKSGIPIGEINTQVNAQELLKKAYPNGYNVHGGLIQALEAVCDANAMRAYVSKGKLYIEPKQLNGQLTTVVNVGIDNFKGTLDKKKVSHGKSKTAEPDADDKSDDLDLTLYLDGRINLNSIARLTVPGYEGDYEIKSIRLDLDYEGDAWDTKLKISPIAHK